MLSATIDVLILTIQSQKLFGFVWSKTEKYFFLEHPVYDIISIPGNIYTYNIFQRQKGASLAANMLQMGQIYGQVSQSGQGIQNAPSFYDSNQTRK